ncbi:hypothetical protein [uncultured Lutibacter sp.]|uniref:hypothetical protein n=1 Tax=uncultured Lutibacter sp. TaxID=437739 RepID=UPI00261803F5|nr:hypothetical protein [uncultured Lutibacter sp.]
MKFFTTLLLVWGFGLFSVYAQVPTKEKELDDFVDEFFMEDELINDLIKSLSKYQFLYISTTYNSDTYFSGRDIGIDQYNVSPQITYVNSSGLFASLSGNYYSDFVPNWDVTTVTVGYGNNFGKKKLFKYYASYSKYLYANDSNAIYSNTLNAGLGIRNKNRTLGTQLSGAFLFGEDESFQITSNSYASFNLLKTKKSSLKLKPQISISAGKQTIDLARINFIGGEIVTEYIRNETFNLINTQLSIPLQYNVNSFDFEVGYTINFPHPIGEESNLTSTSFFSVSLAYMIGL